MTAKTFLNLSLFFLLLRMFGQAQDEAPLFSVKSYQLPADDLVEGFVSESKGTLKAPALPVPSRGDEDYIAWLRTSNVVLKEYLTHYLIPYPKGTLAAFDPQSKTLTLRATGHTHELVQDLVESHSEKVPKFIQWELKVYRCTPAEGRAILLAARTEANHVKHAKALETKALPVIQLSGETKSGQRVSSAFGGRVSEALGYEMDGKGRTSSDSYEQTADRYHFELDPTMGHDGMHLDINTALTLRTKENYRWQPLTSGFTTAVTGKLPAHHVVKIQSATHFLSGETRLLGQWLIPPSGEVPESVELAFLTAGVVPLLPEKNEALAVLLEKYGDAVETQPKEIEKIVDPTLPEGMEVRRYRVPSDFLSVSSEPQAAAAPADPFAAGGAVKIEPRFMRSMTVEEILKGQGISFPPGSSANLQGRTLIVRNLPKNLDLVEAFVTPLDGNSRAKALHFTTHFIQADSDTIHSLSTKTQGKADHSSLLLSALSDPKVKVLRSSWVATPSGHRVTFEDGEELYFWTEVQFGSHTQQPKAEKDKPAPLAIVERSDITASTSVMHRCGLGIELDPVLGADGSTLEVNYTFDYDTAPPHVDVEPVKEGETALSAPQMRTHRATHKSVTTLLNGSARLLHVWKPSGAAELEGDLLQAVFLTADVVSRE